MKKIKSRRIRIRKKKLLKWVSGLIVVLFLSQIGYVDAGINDSTIERNRVDGVYAVVTLDGQQRIFYLNMYRMNGRIAYCIELGVDITTDIYHSTNDFSASYLSSEQAQYIRAISYFGYQYLGHEDSRYYMAAQELIWEYLSNTNVEWTNVLDVNGERINIESYKDEILALKARYYEQVLFDWKDGQEYFNGEKISLLDSAGVLADYEVVSSGHSKVSINDNYLNIEVSDDYVGREEIILRKKNYYDYDSVLYYHETSQRLISNGNYQEIEEKLEFSIVGRNMKVQVLDRNTGSNTPRGQATLKGAVYELYNEKRELVGTFESNQTGSFVVENIPYGTYYFKQKKASEGYLYNGKEELVQFLDENKTINLLQEVITNIIEIKKVYGSNDSYIPEADIYFEVIDWRGNVYKKVGTNKNGKVIVILPYGTYTISQVNTTWGYSMVPSFEVMVKEWKASNVFYNLVNDLIQYKVRINTIDADSGNKFLEEGFVYRLRKKDNDNYIEVDGCIEFVADSDGSFIFPKLLDYGDYVLEQVDVPKGILINSAVLEFSINEQTEIKGDDDEIFIDVNFYNKRIRGKIEILANEEIFYSEVNSYDYKLQPREETKFLLVANNDIVVNGEILYHQGDEVLELITDKDGLAISQIIYLGDYCLIDMDKEIKECFSLESISNEEEFVEKKIEVTKLLDKSDILIINKDEFNQGIEGNVFEVYGENGNLIYTGATNEEGFIQVKDLVHGDYCVVQKSVSDDWKLITDKKCISLENDLNVDFVNKRKENTKIWVPNTFSDASNGKLLIHVIGLIGLIFLVYKKMFVHN